MELIKFIFSGFWIFIGSLLMLALILDFVLKFCNRILRHRNIRKLGYPPENCDADGDFKPEPKEDDE